MTAQDTVFSQKIKQIFDPAAKPLIMGILNITDDSFFDGGKYTEEGQWLEQTKKMLAEGADIIDIGAYSTRPGAKDIPEAEETKRLLEVTVSLKENFPGITLSVDTFRASVAEKVVAAGADLINDISGGTMDEQMFETVARLKVPYVLMHIQGTPQTMQVNPSYKNVVAEVLGMLQNGLKKLQELGHRQVIIDPGLGFGKTVEQNYELMKNLEKFGEFNCPVLAGVSRKSFINKLLNIKSKEALNGTTILNTIAVQKGAKIIRVHDVKEAREVLTILNEFKV
ncbi:MAG: Dihydropteroate synthase [Bacteroidetes bacterium]|nr:Dihydropteroate synthase [Bacteroidota bacterium]